MIGATGSGKTTFARALAATLQLRFGDTDDLFWEPGWVEIDNDVFRQRMDDLTKDDRWVVAGNYFSRAVDIVWPRADTIVWLDLPLPLVLYRSVMRTAKRSLTREVVCNGNTERLRFLLPIGDKPLWLYAIAFKPRQHPRIERFLTEHPHLTVHRLRSRAEVARFLGQTPE